MNTTKKLYAKTKHRGQFSAVCGGLMTLAGIILLVIPFLSEADISAVKKNFTFLIVGGILLITGFCIMVSGLTQWLIRPYSVVFTEDGLYDFTGKHKNGMFIEWNNIKDARIYGKGSVAFIGIELISLEMAEKHISYRDKREIYENISANMPAVIIRQTDVKAPVSELADYILQTRLGKTSAVIQPADKIMEEQQSDTPVFTPEEVQQLCRTGNIDMSEAEKFKSEQSEIDDIIALINSSSSVEKKEQLDSATEDEAVTVAPAAEADADKKASEEAIAEAEEKAAEELAVAEFPLQESETQNTIVKEEASKNEEKQEDRIEKIPEVRPEATTKTDSDTTHTLAVETKGKPSIDDLLSLLSIGEDK